MSKIKVFALGGLNENGKNMYVVNVDEEIFIFDCGLKYDNDINLGIDYIIPGHQFLIDNKDKIKGLSKRTGWISLQSKGLSRVFYNTTVQKHQFFSAQLSL